MATKSSIISLSPLLNKLGLDTSEVRVYLALSELGQTTTGPLVKKSGLPSSKIYHVLSSLIEKGLVGYILHGGIKFFRPSRPIALRHLLDLKEQEIQNTKLEVEESIPLLDKIFLAEKADYKVEILEGLRGVKTIYDISFDLAKPGDEMYTMGYPILASELLNAYFKEFHKKMAHKGLKAKLLYDHDTWFWKKREPRPHAEQRYLPKGIKTPAFVHIFKDHIGIMVVTEQQKFSVFIKNKEVADSYVHYFHLLWKIGKRT